LPPACDAAVGAFVSFRDIQPIWDVFSQVLFYASPVIIPVETVKEKLAYGKLHVYVSNGVVHHYYTDVLLYHVLYRIYLLNPLVVVFQQFRHAMINHAVLNAGQVLGSWLALLEPLGSSLACSHWASGCSTAQPRWSPRISRRTARAEMPPGLLGVRGSRAGARPRSRSSGCRAAAATVRSMRSPALIPRAGPRSGGLGGDHVHRDPPQTWFSHVR